MSTVGIQQSLCAELVVGSAYTEEAVAVGEEAAGNETSCGEHGDQWH